MHPIQTIQPALLELGKTAIKESFKLISTYIASQIVISATNSILDISLVNLFTNNPQKTNPGPISQRYTRPPKIEKMSRTPHLSPLQTAHNYRSTSHTRRALSIALVLIR